MMRVYPAIRTGLNEPAPRTKKGSKEAQQKERAKRAEELQAKLDHLQDEIDAVEKEMVDLPFLDLTGKTIRTKMYGDVIVDHHEGNYLSFTAEGKQRQYVSLYQPPQNLFPDANITREIRPECEHSENIYLHC